MENLKEQEGGSSCNYSKVCMLQKNMTTLYDHKESTKLVCRTDTKVRNVRWIHTTATSK